jgi:hypothetical protein
MRIFNARRRQSGAVGWFVLLLVLFLIFVGTVLYIIWKALQNLPERPTGDEVSNAIWEEKGDVECDYGELYPDKEIYVVSGNVIERYQTNPPVGFTPFSGSFEGAIIERSTNLINWDRVAVLDYAGQQFVDTNPPPNQAFYRMK